MEKFISYSFGYIKLVEDGDIKWRKEMLCLFFLVSKFLSKSHLFLKEEIFCGFSWKFWFIISPFSFLFSPH